MNTVFNNKNIPSELGIVIGTVTSSKDIVNEALKAPKGEINMCKALEMLKDEGRAEGRAEGRVEGVIEGVVKTYKQLNASKETLIDYLQSECGVSKEKATEYIRKYW